MNLMESIQFTSIHPVIIVSILECIVEIFQLSKNIKGKDTQFNLTGIMND